MNKQYEGILHVTVVLVCREHVMLATARIMHQPQNRDELDQDNQLTKASKG